MSDGAAKDREEEEEEEEEEQEELSAHKQTNLVDLVNEHGRVVGNVPPLEAGAPAPQAHCLYHLVLVLPRVHANVLGRVDRVVAPGQLKH